VYLFCSTRVIREVLEQWFWAVLVVSEFLSISVCFLSLLKNTPKYLKNKPKVISVISVSDFGLRRSTRIKTVAGGHVTGCGPAGGTCMMKCGAPLRSSSAISIPPCSPYPSPIHL
jgi:hypothetical protein